MSAPLVFKKVILHTPLIAADGTVEECHELAMLSPVSLEGHLQTRDEVIQVERLRAAFNRFLADDDCVGVLFPEE